MEYENLAEWYFEKVEDRMPKATREEFASCLGVAFQKQLESSSCAKARRKQKMKDLRGDGYTLQEIGDMYGISRERVRQVIGNTGNINQIVYPDGYRRCYRCKQTLPEEDFYTEKCNVCIECTRKRSKELMKTYQHEFRKGGKYYEKQKCRQMTHQLIKSGKLVKGECESKGPDCKGRIEAHHYAGYEHPELVQWYCQHHHQQIDGSFWGRG